jgi:esterase/lipase superfamily enzyme
VILAAADMDFEVITQRLIAERMQDMCDELTIYLNERDKALGIADWLFGSLARLGDIRESQLDEARRISVNENPDLTVIDVRVKSGFVGHGYFISNPAVLSDLILLLRYNREPGEEHGRPLLPPDNGFWELHEGYPNVKND